MSCDPPTLTKYVSRKMTKSRPFVVSAIDSASRVLFGSAFASSGVNPRMSTCSNVSIFCGTPSSSTSKSAAVRSGTIAPLAVG